MCGHGQTIAASVRGHVKLFTDELVKLSRASGFIDAAHGISAFYDLNFKPALNSFRPLFLTSRSFSTI